uniref:Uncharacterized protein n=1 Tax=Cucumis melo TaxID=3656 RepID=A0A9I9E8I6_CUCME
MRKEEEEFQEVLLKKDKEIASKASSSAKFDSHSTPLMGRVRAIIEVVLFRGLSEFIHKESHLHILSSGCLTGQKEIGRIYTSGNYAKTVKDFADVFINYMTEVLSPRLYGTVCTQALLDFNDVEIEFPVPDRLPKSIEVSISITNMWLELCIEYSTVCVSFRSCESTDTGKEKALSVDFTPSFGLSMRGGYPHSHVTYMNELDDCVYIKYKVSYIHSVTRIRY